MPQDRRDARPDTTTRTGGGAADTHPVIDQDDWDARLADARARRAEVLARRIAEQRGPTPDPAAEPGPEAALNSTPAEATAPHAGVRQTFGARRTSPQPGAHWFDGPRRKGAAGGLAMMGAFCVGLGFALPFALVLAPAFQSDRAAVSAPVTLAAPAMPREVSLNAPASPAQSAPATLPDAVPATDTAPARGQAGPDGTPKLAASPAPDAPPPGPQMQTADTNDPGAGEAPPIDPPTLARAKIHVNVPRFASQNLVADKIDALRQAGFSDLPRADTPYTIRTGQVRFYHAEDAQIAELVARQADVELRDFTSYAPKPRPGTVELWMAGRSTGAQVTRSKPGFSLSGELRTMGAAFSDLVESFPRGNER
ncbi:hypothetical protein DKT77_09890 [Meridianimarinicoccus roseus]|uniref:Uncharacterized protein n=1 Tax=Meridianimarinicoccus roseus TaxID=2072018 RepID=A0A2V2LC35_9RHOB|nr:hypothetical protein [Meridianimarinicoccus roseus]PWR02875.1 hypothetical protein DKT77_09890 [Meridianimarinicoccus roseus]